MTADAAADRELHACEADVVVGAPPAARDGRAERGRGCELLQDFGHVGLFAPLRQRTLLIEEGEQPHLPFEQEERRGGVGGDGRVEDHAGVDPLFGHLAHLLRAARLDELRLQLLVRKVDAQLLERVDRKVLEAEDVEQPDEAVLGGGAVVGRHPSVEPRQDPLKQRRVRCLGQRVARVGTRRPSGTG